jgi:chromosome segregation ATPase
VSTVTADVDGLISQLQELDSDISDLTMKLNATNEEHSPNVYKNLQDELSHKNSKKNALKEILTNKKLVNDYINQNYQELEALNNNVV